jgi:hypothetical protein
MAKRYEVEVWQDAAGTWHGRQPQLGVEVEAENQDDLGNRMAEAIGRSASEPGGFTMTWTLLRG